MTVAGDLVYGRHAVRALLESDPGGLVALWIQDNRRDAFARRAAQLTGQRNVHVEWVPRAFLDSLTDGAAHQGVAARYRKTGAALEVTLDSLLASGSRTLLLLVLDGIQDPHNLGACLRSAAALGVDAVVTARRRGAGLSPVVRKVASGGAEAVPLLTVTNLARTLKAIGEAGVLRVGAAAEGESDIEAVALGVPLALVMGSEGAGMRRLTREQCDVLVRVPLSGPVASLNVSVATGICLFEVSRQRRALLKSEVLQSREG